MMKKLVYLLVFLILVQTLFASDANVYHTESFDNYPEQIMVLEDRDAFRIDWNGTEHTVMVREIYPNKSKVDLTAFIIGAETPFYASINTRTSLELDFDKDYNPDLKISIFNILKDEKVVALKLKKLVQQKPKLPEFNDEQDFMIISDESNEDDTLISEQLYQKMPYLFLIALFLIAIISWKRRSLLRLYRKIKRKRK